MKKLKDIDYKIISELMKNTKISDKELAKKLRVSKPTASRRKASLEEKGLFAYSVIPSFEEFGYDLLAFTFIHFDFKVSSGVFGGKIAKITAKAIQKHPNVIFGSSGRGLGYEAILVSVHRTFGDYMKFKDSLRTDLVKCALEIRSFAISIKGDNTFSPLSFAYLGTHLKSE